MKAKTRNKLDHSMSIIVSMAVNGLLFMALLTYIQMSAEPDTNLNKTIVIEPTEQEILDEVKQEVVEEIREPDEIQQQLDYAMDDFSPTEITTESEVVDTTTPTDINEMTQLLSDIASPVVMSGLMVGRTALGRQAAVGRYGGGGGGGQSEVAVNKALQWLRDRQLPSGAWNISGNVSESRSPSAGMTGLALLAFLAHGETPSSAEYGRTVTRAIRFLVDNQNSRGYFQPAGSHAVYGHAIATYAIAEAYTMTENALLKEPMERGIQVILNGQQKNGGYDYDYKLSDRNDSSVGAWQIQALKAASIAGASNANLEALLQRGMDGMLANSVERQDGTRGFGYTSGGTRQAISAAGALCMQLVGRGNARETKQTLEYLRPFVPDWEAARKGEVAGSIYFWYYAAQARFHAEPEGRLFRDFNGPMIAEFTKNQNPDGSWTEPKDGARGPVLSTTLGALTLMVYYRHLPTTQQDRIRPAAQEAIRVVDDDVINFAL